MSSFVVSASRPTAARGSLARVQTQLAQPKLSVKARQHVRNVRSARLTVKASAATIVKDSTQLAQLASMTTLSVDTGDLKIIEELASTGLITDATTNPLFVSQAGQNNDPVYAAFVNEAVEYAKGKASGDEAVALAIDRLAVNLGREIVKLVPGYVSTEVDPRLSWDFEESLFRARRIIAMYEEAGVPKERVLIKLAGTWEGIKAAEVLEKEGVTCNITLVFGFAQAVAAAQAGARLISPFPGRVKDFVQSKTGQDTFEPSEDPGVVEVTRMYRYYKKYGHDTIVMPASWRPSRPGQMLDEILGLAGTDRMTIPPPLIAMLRESEEPVPRLLEPAAAAAACTDAEVSDLDEKRFRFMLNQDACTTEKMAEGLRAFISDTDKLEEVIRDHPMW